MVETNMLFVADGVTLILIAFGLVYLGQHVYRKASIGMRMAIFAMCFFCFCQGVHQMGVHWVNLMIPYWARWGMDVALLIAMMYRLFDDHFLPPPPKH